MFVPANIPPDSSKSSGAEDSDVDGAHFVNDHQKSRRVRFKQLVGVLTERLCFLQMNLYFFL